MAPKIGIILLHAGKDTRELYKTLSWKEQGDEKKFKKAWRVLLSPEKSVMATSDMPDWQLTELS